MFDSGRAPHAIRGAQAALTASRGQANATAQNIAFATIRAYYRALLADDEKTTTLAAVQRAQAFPGRRVIAWMQAWRWRPKRCRRRLSFPAPGRRKRSGIECCTRVFRSGGYAG